MLDIELATIPNKELSMKHIKIMDMEKVDNYLFIILNNGQKILTNGKDLYDVSDYNHLSSIFHMGDKFCAVMTKNYSLCVVDLKTMEVLFEDERAYDISKQDDRTLHIIMKIGDGNNTIYDIETKKYLKVLDNYEFESSLGNNLYVFREEFHSDTGFYDYKRCVINADGKLLLKDIIGWIDISDNHLIITNRNKLCIVRIDGDSTVNMQTIEQNEEIIAKPKYYNENLIIMEKGVIKLYTLDSKLVNEFVVDELNEVIDYEIVSNTLKLCLPHTIDGEQVNKHLFINLNTGKSISHLRIEGYPYWMPTTFIGKDSVGSEITDCHFYDANFEPIIKVLANSYESVECNKECMFVIKTLGAEGEQKQLLNAESGSIRKVDYDYIYFHHKHPYGYGVNLTTEKMDFFDENLNIVIPNFDYKKFDFSFYHEKFGFFIINDYLCIHKHFTDGFGQSRWRTIIQRADGEVLLDSFKKKCYEMGNMIQIFNEAKGKSKFLNTITGEVGRLVITTEIDENGKIDFQNISDINKILSIENNSQLKISLDTEDPQKVKTKDNKHKK